MISLWAESEGLDSHGRLRVFEGSNKLYPEQPIRVTHEGGVDEFKYFWFLSNGAKDAKDSGESWQHTVALAIETEESDFDLFVSVMDGRYPTDSDYDFKSTNLGADSVFLQSDHPMF